MDWKKMSRMLTLLLIAMQLSVSVPETHTLFIFTPLISHSLSVSLSSPAFTWQFHAWLGAAVVKACASPRWWDSKDQNPVLVIVVYTPIESTGTPKPAAWGVSLEHTNTELWFCPENHFVHSHLKRSFLSCLCMFEISWVFRWGVLVATESHSQYDSGTSFWRIWCTTQFSTHNPLTDQLNQSHHACIWLMLEHFFQQFSVILINFQQYE